MNLRQSDTAPLSRRGRDEILRRSFGFLAFIALAGFPAACTEPAPAGPVTRESRNVVDPDELVALAPGPLTADLLVAEAQQRGYSIDRRDTLAGLDRDLLVLRIPSGTDAPAAIRALERAAPGSVVGRNHAYRPEPEPPRPAGSPRAYAAALLGWPAAGCPAAVPVGMIDTAVDPAAIALPAGSLTTRDFTGGAPSDAHGTAIAEILAGPGRLTGVRLYHAAVVGPVPGRAPAAGVDDLVRALDWLASETVGLVNVSLAGPYNKILERGLAAASEHGMTIVAAAGNDGSDAPPRWPAAFPDAIAVTAIDADLEPYRGAPRGRWIDFAAPGVDVYVPLGKGGRYFSGTSIATAFVTAIAATGTEPGSHDRAGAIRARLAQDSRDLGPTGPDDTFGGGLPSAPATCRLTPDGRASAGSLDPGLPPVALSGPIDLQ